LWKSPFGTVIVLSVMERKLSQKEREEPATKGFLEDYLEYTLKKKGHVTQKFLIEHGYVTQEYLEDVLENREFLTKDFLESKNYVVNEHIKRKYVTKIYSQDMFETLQLKMNEDFKHHINSLVEMIREENHIIVEILLGRIERVERYVGMEPI
jgi:hypothetical protein